MPHSENIGSVCRAAGMDCYRASRPAEVQGGGVGGAVTASQAIKKASNPSLGI